MTPCLCKDHSHNVAIVTTAFYDDPTPDAIAFVRENAGKLICFDCGGEVPRAAVPGQNWDHVTATCVVGRLRDLGILKR